VRQHDHNQKTGWDETEVGMMIENIKSIAYWRERFEKVAADLEAMQNDSINKQGRISDLFKELNSKCKECIDLKMELEAAWKELAEAKERIRELEKHV
jgi:peptidoglycan hydrolase CwlO-like protein